MAIQDPAIQPKPALWKVLLNVIYQALGALKAMGKFNRGTGPKL